MSASSEIMDALFPNTRRSTSEYRQTISPMYLTKNRTDTDQNNHDFIGIPGVGKGRATVAVNNKTNQTITVTVYGAQTVTAVPGGAGVFQIGTFDVLTAAHGYQTLNDPFPFYIVRTAFSATPNNAGWDTYVNLHSA